MSDYECPGCHSGKVTRDEIRIKCFSCGYSESLEDYPVAYSQETTFPMPYNSPYRVEPIPPNAFQELSARFNHLQNSINKHIDAKKRDIL